MTRLQSIVIILVILCPSFALSDEILFFNTAVLGQKISQSISPLESPSIEGLNFIEPKVIQLDTDDGRYIASSIYYSAKDVSFIEIAESINKKYPQSRHKIFNPGSHEAWRVEDEKFAISLISESEEGLFRVIYIKFMSTEKTLQNLKESLESLKKNLPEK